MIRTAAGGLLTTLSIALLAVAPASAAQAAAPAALDVAVVTANGSGCPNATASAQSVDSSTFTIGLSAYYAWSGDSAPTTDFRKNCQIALQIDQPAGWTYAVQGADYSGYALLEDGVIGTEAAHYYFQSETTTVTGSHPITGPYTGSWTATDAFTGDDLVFAPCDAERNLNINTEVRVTPGTTGLNWMYLDPSVTVHLAWQACS